MKRLSSFLAALVAILCALRPARAQDPVESGSGDALRAGTEQRRPYWRGSGPERWFAAANFELGVLFFRPVLQLGYGKPHHNWYGVEGYSSPGLGSGRAYAGLHALWPGIDLRGGIRYELPINQHYLAVRDSYDREDLQPQGLGRGKYAVGELEVTGSIEALGGNFFGVATGYAITGVPDDVYLFEEMLNVVVEPPFLWRGRLGYFYHLGWWGSMRLGAAAEAIHLVNREEVIVRAGPLLSVALTHHLEANGAIMIVARSPDSLGLDGADIGQIGLRYRWATGDQWAEFP